MTNQIPQKEEIIRNPDGTFKKGFSGHPEGRPKGKTLKEYAREWFMNKTEEEKNEYITRLEKRIPGFAWKMAEGLPSQTTDITSGGDKITPIYGAVSRHNSNPQDLLSEEEDTSSSGGDSSE